MVIFLDSQNLVRVRLLGRFSGETWQLIHATHDVNIMLDSQAQKPAREGFLSHAQTGIRPGRVGLEPTHRRYEAPAGPIGRPAIGWQTKALLEQRLSLPKWLIFSYTTSRIAFTMLVVGRGRSRGPRA